MLIIGLFIIVGLSINGFIKSFFKDDAFYNITSYEDVNKIVIDSKSENIIIKSGNNFKLETTDNVSINFYNGELTLKSKKNLLNHTEAITVYADNKLEDLNSR